ncbi:MAG: M23 family metallopeptidase [Actinomycetota bacterium]
MGGGAIGSPFGAARDGGNRLHEGNDISAPALQPIVAVSDGTVTRIAGDSGISGYRIHLRHDDGWSSLYIHLNNDTAGTDDSSGIGIRPDLAEGDRVEAGDVIGWNGDSGNAEDTVHHLHFELRDPSGSPVDPRPSLEAATRTTDTHFSGPFSDLAFDPDDPDPLVLLLSRGAPVWCGPGLACPGEPAHSDEVGEWLAALAGSPPTSCGEDCGPVTRADILQRIAWDRLRQLYDDNAARLEGQIPDDAWSAPPPSDPQGLDLSQAYLVVGGHVRCLPLPDGDKPLTRRQAAQAVALYLGWADTPYCPTNAANR